MICRLLESGYKVSASVGWKKSGENLNKTENPFLNCSKNFKILKEVLKFFIPFPSHLLFTTKDLLPCTIASLLTQSEKIFI